MSVPAPEPATTKVVLEAVLALHLPKQYGTAVVRHFCTHCTRGGVRVDYPCPTVTIINEGMDTP